MVFPALKKSYELKYHNLVGPFNLIISIKYKNRRIIIVKYRIYSVM